MLVETNPSSASLGVEARRLRDRLHDLPNSDLRAAVAALAAECSARAAEGDALRTLPADLVRKLKDAGIFRLGLPRSLGGFELEPASIVEIIEEFSRADGSAGWSILIGNSTVFFAWLDPAVARDMIGDNPNFSSSSMFSPAPGGSVEPLADGAYRISGRWPFNSGCPHAEWVQVGVLVPRPSGPPDWMFAFVPRDQVHIEDTWYPLGLRGTGSHHLSMDGVRVPREHLCAPLFAHALHPGPLWRLPGFSLTTICTAGFPLGVARRALDELRTIIQRKARGDGSRTLAQDGYTQVRVAEAEAGLRAARTGVFAAIEDMWQTALAGDEPSVAQRGAVALASNHAMRAAVRAVDTAFALAGGSAVYDDQPLQRCFRDIHTAGQHLMFSTLRDQLWSAVEFEVGEPTFFL